MYIFLDDFTRGRQSDSFSNCSAADESHCTWNDDCSDLKTGPEDWLSAHKTQAYLAWAALKSKLNPVFPPYGLLTVQKISV